MTRKREVAMVRAVVAEALIKESTVRERGGPTGGWARHVGFGDATTAAVFDLEIVDLVRTCPDLLPTAGDGSTALPVARRPLLARVAKALDESCPHAGRTLEALLIADRDSSDWFAASTETGKDRRGRRTRRLLGRVGRLVNG